MTHDNALVTNAMLASYANERNITYIQMIEPFIMYFFPDKIGSKIDVSSVAKRVYDNFGLAIESKAVEKILLNLSKPESGNKVQHTRNKNTILFYVNEKMDTIEFDNKKSHMKNLVSDVVGRLRDFINNEENIIKKIDEQNAEQILVDFLKTYNTSAYRGIEHVEKIQFQDNVSKNNYKVARFIINEYQKELGCFEKIKQIQEGFFASIALYGFFEDVDNIGKNNSLKDTIVVLDTMLLIDALKLDTEYKSNSMEELLVTIHKNGGVLYTFDYYVEELCNIIEKYMMDFDARISLDLDWYRRKKITIAEIALQLKNLQNNIANLSPIPLSYNNLKINIVSNGSYENFIKEENWHIDYSKLENIISGRINYASPNAFKNDCKTVENILYENMIENKNIIFLSSNSELIFAAKDFVKINYKNLFSTDIDLAAKIWLSNYNKKGKLTELALLQNAYAALSPNKEIIKNVLEMIDNNISSSDDRLKNDALLLRYDDDLLYYIASVVKNDKKNINQNTQQELKNFMSKEIFDKIKATQDIEYNEKSKQLKTREYKNKQKENKLDKREHDLLLREQKLYDLHQEKIAAEEQSKIAEKKLNNIIDVTKGRFRKISFMVSIWAIFIPCLVFYGVISIVIYNLAIFCLLNILPSDYVNNIYQIATLLSFILTAISVLASWSKLIMKIFKIINNRFFVFLCKHSKLL